MSNIGAASDIGRGSWQNVARTESGQVPAPVSVPGNASNSKAQVECRSPVSNDPLVVDNLVTTGGVSDRVILWSEASYGQIRDRKRFTRMDNLDENHTRNFLKSVQLLL